MYFCNLLNFKNHFMKQKTRITIFKLLVLLILTNSLTIKAQNLNYSNFRSINALSSNYKFILDSIIIGTKNKSIFQYNEKMDNLTTTFYNFDTLDFASETKTITKINSSGDINTFQFYYKTKSDSVFHGNYKYINVYNSNKEVDTSYFFQYIDSTQKWEKNYRLINSYDSFGNINKQITENWNVDSVKFIGYMISYYKNKYNDKNQLTEVIDSNISYNFNDIRYKQKKVTTFSNLKEISKLYNYNNENWSAFSTTITNYNSSNNILSISEYFLYNSSDSSKSHEFNYTYDQFQNIISEEYFTWDFYNKEIDYAYKSEYFYDYSLKNNEILSFYTFYPNEKIINKIEYGLVYDWNGKSFDESPIETKYYYSKINPSGLEDTNTNGDNDLYVFPNPSNSEFKIESKQAINHVKIYSSNGNFIQTLNPNFDQYSIKNLDNGVYFLEIEKSDSKCFLKIIKN